MIKEDLIDRARGCILGGAIGDAMGGPFEGQPGPLQYVEHDNWSISDDTQLTVATCESIIEVGEVSPPHIAAHFLSWFRARRITGIGASTLKALRDLDAGNHWAVSGAKGEMTAGNGAAMRAAPLAFVLNLRIEEHRRTFRDVCRITHHNDEAYIGALAVGIAIRSFTLQAPPPEAWLKEVVRQLPDSRVRDRIADLTELADDSPIAEVASRFGSSAYVVDSVPLALYAARTIARDPFEVLLRKLIEAGGDTDTNASITGQICGAWLGASRIPRQLIDRLPSSTGLDRIASDFSRAIIA
jgi:ADP-ribosylglycohydrolase